MNARCPHMGLEGNRREVYLVSNSRHRCYLAGLPQRVAGAHQASVCLTSAYRRCPRLLAVRRAYGWQAVGPADGRAPPPGAVGIALPDKVPGSTAAERRRYADLTVSGGGQAGRRRRPNLIEGSVLGLVASIACAVLFIGYAVFHRLQVGPGMTAPPVAEAAAARAYPVHTLVPTFTPTPWPGPAMEPERTPEVAPTPTDSTAARLTPIPEPTLPSKPASQRPPASAPPTRLVLPAIDLDIPVGPVGTKAVGQGASARIVWGDLPDAAGFHETSAYPGNPGNTVINGHRDIHAAVFRHLNRVEVGDEIILYVGEVAYPYQVSEILIVPEAFATAAQRAENRRLIGPMPEERLTLVTCTPPGLATHRLLVIARPPEQTAPQGSQAGTGQ